MCPPGIPEIRGKVDQGSGVKTKVVLQEALLISLLKNYCPFLGEDYKA